MEATYGFILSRLLLLCSAINVTISCGTQTEGRAAHLNTNNSLIHWVVGSCPTRVAMAAKKKKKRKKIFFHINGTYW